MDFDAAMEHARQVGREAVRLGVVDSQSIARFQQIYASYVKQGVQGSFVDLLHSRKAIDRGIHQILDMQFPSDHLKEEPYSPVEVVSAPQPPPKTSGRHPTMRMAAIKIDDVVPPPRQAPPPVQPVEDALAWLECEPLEPIPIVDFATVTVGRGKDCTMVLPHQGVSRVHATITAAGERLLLEDQSTYGTFVNGEQVKTHTLLPGDVIAIGPYMIIVRDDDPYLEDPPTLPFRIPGFAVESMHGKLTEVALSEVLQQIEFNAKTGTLRVTSQREQGLLVFEEGKPRWAKLGALRDAEAVFGMMALVDGEFSFMAEVEEGEATMTGTVTALLMEASRRLDEQ